MCIQSKIFLICFRDIYLLSVSPVSWQLLPHVLSVIFYSISYFFAKLCSIYFVALLASLLNSESWTTMLHTLHCRREKKHFPFWAVPKQILHSQSAKVSHEIDIALFLLRFHSFCITFNVSSLVPCSY